MKVVKLTILFALVIMGFTAFSQDKQKDENKIKKDKNYYLLFELGVVYPELEFIDSDDVRSLNSDAINISSNRIAIGGGGDLIKRLGYLLTLSNNRYDIRTYFDQSNSRHFVHYNFDYAALDANLTFRLFKPSTTLIPNRLFTLFRVVFLWVGYSEQSEESRRHYYRSKRRVKEN
jgi:hypothetical protein